MEADIIGLNKIIDTIKNLNFSKISIYRYPQNSGNLPVFEKLHLKNNFEVIKEFTEWGRNIDNSVIYEISLFNDVDITIDNQGKEVTKKSQSRTSKARFLIQFKKEQQNYSSNNQNNDLTTIVSLVSENLKKSQEENLILKELTELKAKITELEEEEEDEPNILNGIKPEMISQFLGALGMFTNNNNKQSSVINGVIDDKKENINKAIKILYKYDEDLDKDLLKLSSLAENNNSTFKMLLQTLRSM